MRHAPGGIQSLEEGEREQVLKSGDPQLDRAMDLLKGITLFTQRSPVFDQRVARGKKMAAK